MTTKEVIQPITPDYSYMFRLNTNGAILEAFISLLFSKSKFSFKTIISIFRNMIILIIIKTILEDSKNYIDKFKITNIDPLKYFYQRIRYSQINYEILLIGGKWYYLDKPISINYLSLFLEKKSIFISQHGAYYFNYRTFLIKTIITPTKIIFKIPNLSYMINYIETEVIHKNREIILNGKTNMLKVIFSSSNNFKLEPMQISYAFPTENYITLEKTIKNYFLIDSVLKFSSTPFCVNFNGEPGTGKTTFGNYIANSSIFDKIIICNLVQASNISFNEIIISLERQISINKIDKDNAEKILIIFDEIDKWLESYINYSIDKLREESRSSKQTVSDKSSLIEKFEKLTNEEENDKKNQIKNVFFDQLYKLIDGHILSDMKKYVLIFNTNNFDLMFEKIEIRYVALRDRFQRYIFNKINKMEIIEYFKCIKKTFNDFYVKTDKKDKYELILNNNKEINYNFIPDNIEITYRNLHKKLRDSHFDIIKTIDLLRN